MFKNKVQYVIAFSYEKIFLRVRDLVVSKFSDFWKSISPFFLSSVNRSMNDFKRCLLHWLNVVLGIILNFFTQLITPNEYFNSRTHSYDFNFCFLPHFFTVNSYVKTIVAHISDVKQESNF